ncbi:hypothetical protein BBF96_02765 [Anoxybacter fermentans]|uniref:VanW family protein n=1 Tax=Anoxybacter fermentans TaxID=1323375 RepID=A0A3S9SVV6_9FIRM|nr:VanW family protein [Anoxybacter fermentans]AZR72408.1 hypothetical protein BBF96_02765 [Anoxybacter fermentans]
MIRNKFLSLFKNSSFYILFSLILIFFVLVLIGYWYRSYYGIPKGVWLGEKKIGGLYPDEVRNLLLQAADDFVRWPEPARLDNKGNVTHEVWGRILDLSATMELIESAKEGDVIEPVFCSIYPLLLSSEILALTRLLGVYHTFVGGTEDRYHNIKLAGSLINFTLLMPNEVFSFNQKVGEPTPERGFKRAPIIIKDKMVLGYGGGICQVSSTLYNAALQANLKIIERHTHSKKVNYVPPGKDATVAYDYLDLKFINSLEYPILIRVWLRGNKLIIGIYGREV